MDHSVAVVRRYPEVKLYHDDNFEYGHAGMVVHPDKRILYIANPASGNIVAVHIDTARYSRTARDEYPIFSNKLPSFEYSIYECVDQEEIFATGFTKPAGLALSNDGKILFVAERLGRITAVEVDSGETLQSIDIGLYGHKSIGGLTVSPTSGLLYFTDMDNNQVVRVDPSESDGQCTYESRASSVFETERGFAQYDLSLSSCGDDSFSLVRDYTCKVDATIPNGTLFEQVHSDTGYASDNPDVQSTAGMDEEAVLLANRTDCEYDSDLNFDALLLGGYFCHQCLPRNNGSSCDAGGACANVHWRGYTCDNEFYVDFDYTDDNNPTLVLSSLYLNETFASDSSIELSRGVTYRFTVRTGAGRPVSIESLDSLSSELAPVESTKSASLDGITNGPILLTVDESTPNCMYLTSPRTQALQLMVEGATDCKSISGSSSDVAKSSAFSARHLLSFIWNSAILYFTLAWVLI
jgi:hypothetical protein